MRSFINTYKPEIAFVINSNLNEEIKIDKCIVRFIDIKRFVESTNILL